MFKISFGNTSGVFGVPNEVVDQHLKLSGALSLKILLLMLRQGREMSVSEMAQTLNQSEGDIKDALNQWLQAGLVVDCESQQPKNVSPSKILEEKTLAEPKPAQKSAPEQDEQPKIVLKERFYRMNRHDVNLISDNDNNIGVLLEESQNTLGKILSSGESETLVSLYHHYGMQIDIIIMILEHCKSIGKDTPAYYEKMAIEWINKEINTHEKADKELLRLKELSQQEQAVRKLFGIYDRNLTKKEMEFYNIWTEEYKSSTDMITLAFERTIDIKGKISFNYIHAIMKSWHEKGITTTAQAEQESKQIIESKSENNKSNSTKPSGQSSYDLGELEKMISQGVVWD